MSQRLLLAPPERRSLNQSESLALVQIFLNASLACISHTRELIPWTSPGFRTRYIDQIDPEILPGEQDLYAAFQALTSKNSNGGQEIRILVRGGHKRADQLLDMLENGVFEALDRGYLESLQVFVSKPSGHPQTVLEIYCFGFRYEHGRVSSIRLSPIDHTFVLENIHKSFKAAIRALLRSLKDLPRLPTRRKLGMSLTYTEQCPLVYQPPGFVDKEDFEDGDKKSICDAILQGTGDIVGTLDTQHHQVSVAVLLQCAGDAISSPDLQDATMSKQLKAMQKTSSFRSTNLISTMRDSAFGSKRETDGPVRKAKRVKHANFENPLDDRPVIRAGLEMSRQELDAPVVASNEMAADGSLFGSDFVAPSPSSGTGRPRLIASKLAELLVHCHAIQCGVAGNGGKMFDQELLSAGTIMRHHRSNEIRCECGSQRTSSDMHFCEVCGNWQHRKCYGYNDDAVDQPNERFCYTCLLSSINQKLDDSPSFIIFMRMAVENLTSKNKAGQLVNEVVLRKKLNCRWTRQLFDMAIDRLVEEGLLEVHDELHWQTKFLGASELRRLKEMYISPMALIGNLYESRLHGEEPVKRKNEIARAIAEYSRGQDYTIGEGCEELVLSDDFGLPVLRWGYRNGSNASISRSSPLASPTQNPGRRRKVSISRILIEIDHSPSPGSMISDESTSRFHEETANSSDFSTETAD